VVVREHDSCRSALERGFDDASGVDRGAVDRALLERLHAGAQQSVARVEIRDLEDFDLQSAALLGVASVSLHDARRAQVKVDDNVLVFGAGLIGQFSAQAARVMGAQITVADRHDDRLWLAAELGADRTVNTASAEGQAALQAHQPYSVIFECSGGDVLDQIIGTPHHPGLIGRRAHARLVLVAGRFDVRYNFNAAGMAEVDILHTQHFDQSDLELVVRLAAKGDLRIRPLIRDVAPIEDAIRIFDLLRDDPSRLLGTIFDFTPG
jgi:threonine dehydrogenase-like Zn-dependent dehydrogenase